MIPLAGARQRTDGHARAGGARRGGGVRGAAHDGEVDYGTMVEVPRAALTADEMAREAEFFSFGTNDLTQTTFWDEQGRRGGKVLEPLRQGGYPEE